MQRRDLLKQLTALSVTPFFIPGFRFRAENSDRRLFFSDDEIPAIRANAASPLLRPTYELWAGYSKKESLDIIERPLETGDLLTDFGRTLTRMYELSTVYLISRQPAIGDLVRRGLDVLARLPKWDYTLERGEVVGIMRASKAVTVSLFAREVLDGQLSQSTQQKLLSDVAEKGVAACALAIRCMNNPAAVDGWVPDANHRDRLTVDMRNWPTIFSGINLRAVPTMGLGLGALALEGIDDRATGWLDLAVDSAQQHLACYEADGSYWEGLSYVDFALRTMLLFLEAYDRVHGGIDWSEHLSYDNLSDYIASMQFGRTPDGSGADIVNFSDARTPTMVCVNSWLHKKTGNPLAQYNANHFSHAGYFADFLWYQPGAAEVTPPDSLKNRRLDLDWMISRTGWDPDDAMLAFRGGKAANHEHADRNSLIYKYLGERLLADPFGAAYNASDPHWLLRLTDAHNAVLVNGVGHHYVDGSEGTNAGKAEANTLAYVDLGESVWWVSDATKGYQLVNPEVSLVRRSVFYSKPGFIILYDEVESIGSPVTASVRFHPDNRDNAASVETGDKGFVLRRPRAHMSGFVHAQGDPLIAEAQLLIPRSYGTFPFVEVSSAPNTVHRILTVLTADRTGEMAKDVLVEEIPGGFVVQSGAQTVRVNTTGSFPEFRIT